MHGIQCFLDHENQATQDLQNTPWTRLLMDVQGAPRTSVDLGGSPQLGTVDLQSPAAPSKDTCVRVKQCTSIKVFMLQLHRQNEGTQPEHPQTSAAHLPVGGLQLTQLLLDCLQRSLSMLIFWTKVMLL